MADKRISQLIERVDIANNDVLPIVASGATTTNKVTVSTLQDWMQDNLDVGVTSVGLSMPSAFVVSNSPVTASGNISVTGAGTVSQYIRGDGSLADFPSGGGGGGASVNYYLNGSVSQGTIGGIAYQEMNRTPILGAGTDFTIAADGYIASFITDAGDPALLEIPAGNWNFETYLQASSGGGTPSFYIELYKVSYPTGTATLIASNSATPELIAFGTTTTPYFSALAVPTTSLTLTDRLALRYYVTHSGRTITLHTENNTLCQIVTTFTTGLTALNGLTAQVQNFATGTSGTDFNISSSVSTHTFNLPTASATNRGALSSSDWTTFNNKQNALTNPVTGTGTSGRVALWSGTNAVTSDAELTYNSTTNLLTIGGGITLTGAQTIQTSTGNLTLLSAAGNGNIVLTPNGTGTTTINSSVTATSFVRSGGTSSQFLKADGSVDSNSYALNSSLSLYLPLTGGTISGQLNVGSGNLRIAAEGASNITILRNFTGTAQGQSGFNHIGFNNSNNFYFTKDLNNGAIFSFNNTAYQTYTLPDASGTIALTSSLSEYLPLTGGTLTGALNGTSANFTTSILPSVDNTGVVGNSSFTWSNGQFTNLTVDSTMTVTSTLNVRAAIDLADADVLRFGTSDDWELFHDGTHNYMDLNVGNLIIRDNVTTRFTFERTTGNLISTGSITATGTILTDGASNGLFLRNGFTAEIVNPNPNTRDIQFNQDTNGTVVFKANGNVGIGTASPNLSGGAAGSTILTISATSSGRNGVLELNGTRTNSTDISGYVRFFNNGAATPLADIRAIRGSSDTSGDLAFTTADTERMRITSGGYLKASNNGVYISPTTTYHELRTTTDARVAILTNASATLTGQNGILVYFQTAAPNNSVASFIDCEDSGTLRFQVRSNGGIANFQANNVNLSDERTKKDIEPLESYWDKFKAIEIVKFKYKDQTHDDFNIGLIAQQVEAVAPEFVDVDGWDTKPELDEEGNEIVSEEEPLKSIYTADLHHATIKVLQEAMAKIEKLETEIDSLKNQMQ